MTDMYLISGFLGAGKTTLIQKLLTEAFKSKKVALIENDFGDFSVDAALLREGGYQVRELNAGCICCSLTGDFTAALASLLKTYRPDVVLIEPSGVGKLSDVERACGDRRFATSARITQKITVVDVKRCASYLENFGAFFEDQVRSAGTILLNRTELFPGAVTKAVELVEQLNGQHALVFYSFQHDRDRLLEALTETKLRVRVYANAEDEAAWNRGEIDVLLAHPASCGYGLNLQQGGHHAIWFGLTWSLEQYEQANKRLHRNGQEHPVVIHHLLVQGGMDETVREALKDKGDMQNALMAALKVRIREVGGGGNAQRRNRGSRPNSSG